MLRAFCFIILSSLVLLVFSCQKKSDGNSYSPTPPSSGTAISQGKPNASCSVEITEVLPSNGAALRDSYGNFSDWIEIHNAGSTNVQLTDFYLSDKEDDPQMWRIPFGELAPGGYALIYASGAETTDTELHAPFKLSKDGESILLTHKSGEKSVFTYTAAEKNMSVLPDGTSTYFITPGFSNDDTGYASYISTLAMPNGLCITEVMNANSKYLPHDGTYSDWVELYNNSDVSVNLGAYCLSDDSDELSKCSLPNVNLDPHAYYTVYCDDKDNSFTSFVTDFSLGSDEDIFLSMQGKICDFLSLHDIPYGASYGRQANAGYAYFENPTPGTANSNGTAMITATPHTSVPQGVYNDVQGLTVELLGEGDIYYTTDGSEPTLNSQKYSAPISLVNTAVIRAKAYLSGKLDSRIMTASFIINENHSLPVLSLATDRDNLFDPETGIYVKGNHENYYQDWEKSASLTLFENGETKFSADCGLRMFGSGSRADCEKKSLRVNFKAKYGMSKLNSDVFSDGITGYKSLVMRAGEDAPYTIFRNEVFTTLAKDTNLLVQNNKYCILYVDGEYFGIFCLCERFSDTYYAQHHNIDESLVSVYDAPTSSSTKAGQLMAYAKNHDMSTAESYAYMNEHLDLDGMIDWFVMQAYAHNGDLSGNLRYFYRADTDFIEYAFYDLDWAFYRRENRFSILTDGEQYSIIMQAMLKNATFRERFINRTGYLLNNVLTDSKVLSIISSYEELIRPEIVRERAKWKGEDGTATAESWQRAVARMKNYVTKSSIKEEMIQSLRTYISLTDIEAEKIRNG